MTERRASRTAILVCQGRAAADGRLAAGRFADPLAVELLTEDERGIVGLVRARTKPKGFADAVEYELLTATAEVMAARTVVIDDALREKGNQQLVILGAGLDARAWRMPELASVEVFEVDQPASQGEKRERMGERQPLAAVRYVPVDFEHDSLGTRLGEADHDETVPTTWIWEGVVMYLTPEQVAATLGEIAKHSAPGSRLILTYQTPSRLAGLGRKAASLILARSGRNPMAHEPTRSQWTPEPMRNLLNEYGFGVISDVDQLTAAQEIGIEGANKPALRAGRVVVADRR
ncbi:class I SAM-dependent methyltransferase [Nocardia sp. 2]|uniref:S-adenosyl-L-methionine-dependent methyltransferase n=1 Tax=Nocardia acididurans TaxID=2802282 RepID=A0ABS1MBG1_9NOCA|nr:class I SAM-dependent methyltransferase [Nocardia acididurans]MBL1076523.1 class I SAM-dependent methyltransferase [Nocardia acididurans]